MYFLSCFQFCPPVLWMMSAPHSPARLTRVVGKGFCRPGVRGSVSRRFQAHRTFGQKLGRFYMVRTCWNLLKPTKHQGDHQDISHMVHYFSIYIYIINRSTVGFAMFALHECKFIYVIYIYITHTHIYIYICAPVFIFIIYIYIYIFIYLICEFYYNYMYI